MTEPADTIINAKELRATLKEVVEGVHSGRRYTVLYRSRPAFRIVPVEDDALANAGPLEEDPIYRAVALGRSDSGDLAERHDEILYG